MYVITIRQTERRHITITLSFWVHVKLFYRIVS